MQILAPYRASLKAKELHCEHLSQEDKVERTGYIPAEKKIQSYIESGLLLQNYRGNSQEYDYEGGETELDPDSPEYLEELTTDADKDSLSPLPQYNDRMELLEQADTLQKRIIDRDNAKRDKTRNAKNAEQQEFLRNVENAVSAGVKSGLKQGDKQSDGA